MVMRAQGPVSRGLTYHALGIGKSRAGTHIGAPVTRLAAAHAGPTSGPPSFSGALRLIHFAVSK